jgi:hypothetical protein
MKIAGELEIDIHSNKYLTCISQLVESGCRINKTELLQSKGDYDRFRIELVYDNADIYKKCLESFAGRTDIIIIRSMNYLDEIISGGFIQIKNSMKIETLSDYEMNVLGVSAVAAEKILSSDNPASDTAVWKNIAIISGMKTKGGKKLNAQYLAYAESELYSAVISRFLNYNAFPLLIKYEQTEDLLKSINAIEPTFSAFVINQTDEDDAPDLYQQLTENSSAPVLSVKLDILPIFILNAVQRLSAKHRFRTKDCTVGFIGIDVSVIRLSTILSRLGFLRVLGFDNNEKNMLNFERTRGLATTPEHIFGNSDIIVLMKEQFTEEDLLKIRPGNIIISLLRDDSSVEMFVRKKVSREILSGKWYDFSLLLPGLVRGLIRSGNKSVNDAIIVSGSEVLTSAQEEKSPYPDIFSDIHDKMSELFNK